MPSTHLLRLTVVELQSFSDAILAPFTPYHMTGVVRSRRMDSEVGMGDGEEEDAQCASCHQYCHFSAVECGCSDDRVACTAHAGALCACPPGRWRLAFRYSLAELDAHLAGVFGAAARVGALNLVNCRGFCSNAGTWCCPPGIASQRMPESESTDSATLGRPLGSLCSVASKRWLWSAKDCLPIMLGKGVCKTSRFGC